MVAQLPHTALTIRQTCKSSRKKTKLFLCQCVGYRHTIRGPLNANGKGCRNGIHHWASSRAIFGKATPINKGTWGKNQRTESDVVCGEKGHTNGGVCFGGFGGQTQWNSRGENQFTGEAKQIIYFFHLCLHGQMCGCFLLAWVRSSRKLLMVSLISV